MPYTCRRATGRGGQGSSCSCLVTPPTTRWPGYRPACKLKLSRAGLGSSFWTISKVVPFHREPHTASRSAHTKVKCCSSSSTLSHTCRQPGVPYLHKKLTCLCSRATSRQAEPRLNRPIVLRFFFSQRSDVWHKPKGQAHQSVPDMRFGDIR